MTVGIFNYQNNEQEKKVNKTPYSVYTTQKINRRGAPNNNKNDLSNEIPIIDDIENKVKNMNDFMGGNNTNANNNKNNNYYNSQRIPNKYQNNNNKLYYNENTENSKEKISEINISEYYDNNCTLIKSFAYKENPNRGFRDYMEDKSRVVQNINGDPNSHLFCLFDGHGGAGVSQFLQDNFHKYFKDIFSYT